MGEEGRTHELEEKYIRKFCR